MRRAGLIYAAIFLSVLAVYGRVCLHEFTWWDDAANLHQNPDMNPPSLRGTAHYWTSFGSHAPFGLYIPITYTVWSALARVAYLQSSDPANIQLNPWVFHSANVLLHALASMLVFAILRRLLPEGRDWPAAAGALLFALHPVQVEPVAWISGLKDVLCGLLGLAAVWQYLLAQRASRVAPLTLTLSPEYRGEGTTGSPTVHYALATLLLLAAMLAKPTAVVVPVMALILDRIVLKRRLRDIGTSLVPWFLLVIPCLLWSKAAQPGIGVPAAPWWARPLIALDSLAFYLWKLVLPTQLAVDYGRSPTRVLEQGWLWWTWIVPVAVFPVLWLNRRRHPMLLAGGAIFVAGVFPVLGFSPFLFQYYSGVTDHYLYLSMFGAALGAAYLVSIGPPRLIAVLSVLVLLLLAGLGFRQGGTWRDDQTLWRKVIAVNPSSALAYNNLGSALRRSGQNDDLVERYYREAIRLNPNFPVAHENLALVLAEKGDTDGVIEQLGEILRCVDATPPMLRPKVDRTRELLGTALMSRHRYAEAAAQFRAALELNPNLESARKNLQLAERRIAQPATGPTSGSP